MIIRKMRWSGRIELLSRVERSPPVQKAASVGAVRTEREPDNL